MKERNRAQRRADDRRVLRRAIRKLQEWDWFDSKAIYKAARRMSNNMANCSCSTCGNERNNRWASNREKLTMQERKAEDDAKDQVGEYYDDQSGPPA